MQKLSKKTDTDKEESDINKRIEMYGKGYQYVSYGTSATLKLPSGTEVPIIKYPSGSTYLLWKGNRRVFNQKLIMEIEREENQKKQIAD